jgi:hypothetical protein
MMASMRHAFAWLVSALALGCSSIGGSAIRTGPLRLPPRHGAIAVFAAAQPPRGTELGVVEVHAEQTEANVETLVPLFVRKVAALGGNAAVIDDVVTTFDIAAHPYTETFTYSCGFRATCVGERTSIVTSEDMIMSIRGRAILLGPAPKVGPP